MIMYFFRMNQTTQWWNREFKSEYVFQMTWDNPGLKDYLNTHNYLSQVNYKQLVFNGRLLNLDSLC